MERDRNTVNVLVLELATMVVAIALAFNADTLVSTTLPVGRLIGFIVVNLVVIWFWWSYVMDRLEFPPKTDQFPVLDVLILVLISLIPFVLRLGNIAYISGLLSALMIIWAIMIRGIIRENAQLEDVKEAKLRREMYERVIVGVMLALSLFISVVSTTLGYTLFIIIILVILLRTIRFRIKRR
ncbi:MAG: hypothetical protein JRN26_03105 [Nitrososphaerota archaeon]|nr:hypothetical protein [Nitrososphaerota archaeon]MDG6930626.1 hypothetical protein [Nitrososphaerota archaeon]MDG6932749.1 hypothetical protein [Nitrososphaerota archaeon]MDG6935862.1 hypothetical protein [Nitrososphaerota archaeon]MDG6944183.1 hypothetical protein [Nitrososphaerota archaeon]